MSTGIWALAPVGVVILGKILEGHCLRRVRSRIPLVIHVNGTRGKTQTVKVLTYVLQASGMRAIAKTTGDRPQLIDCDGSIIPIRRRAPASIAEQAWTMRQAARRGADVLVAECMAIHPELQNVSERSMLRSNIGLITNVRPDHLDVQGTSLTHIASALSSGIPYDGTLFTTETEHTLPLVREANRRRTTVCIVAPERCDGIDYGTLHSDNVALVLAVCKHLGIDSQQARDAIEQYADTCETDRNLQLGSEGKRITFINALSANDPVSTELRLVNEQHRLGRDAPWIGLYCHRRDRTFRAKLLHPLAERSDFASLFVAGDRMIGRRRLFSGAVSLSHVRTPEKLWSRIAEDLVDGSVVFAFGNSGGMGLRLVEFLQQEGASS